MPHRNMSCSSSDNLNVATPSKHKYFKNMEAFNIKSLLKIYFNKKDREKERNFQNNFILSPLSDDDVESCIGRNSSQKNPEESPTRNIE
ncbi:hypothetical protein PUN28_001088 [Cardiocondyla obscurior]|uniref:Uncharacterized protein n=1 Tax=Cardiocondyla obscurior TaxID=286306 RepID=A0AAW2H349_9HYME